MAALGSCITHFGPDSPYGSEITVANLRRDKVTDVERDAERFNASRLLDDIAVLLGRSELA